MSVNILQVGATRRGKTLAAARAAVEARSEAGVYCDPHWKSLARELLVHLDGNVLYDDLSDLDQALGYAMLVPSSHPDPRKRALENQLRAEAFVAILMRRRDGDGMAGTPLMEEWILAALMLFLNQDPTRPPKAPALLPNAFLPGTPEFTALVRDCTLPEIRYKFQQLASLSLRALRAEVGSASRLVNAVFRSPSFAERSSSSFDFSRFLQHRGKLVLERGQEIGDDAMRAIMGAIILLTIEHAKRRGTNQPPIRIVIDEATNARLVGAPELRGLAETNKNGLYWTFLVQNLDFPGGSDAVLQNCLRHEWFGCPNYDLARKAAADVLAGLGGSELSRAERIESLTHEIMTLPAGWRYVRDESGSRKEYVPLLVNPWPDWPGLRDAKLQEKLCRIYRRPEYDRPDANASSNSSPDTPPPPDRLPEASSPAERWKKKRRGRKPTDGSSSNENAE